MSTIRVGYSRSKGIVRFRAPSWPGDYEIEAHEGNGPDIVVEGAQRFEGETWRLVKQRGGTLCLVMRTSRWGRLLPRNLSDDEVGTLRILVPSGMRGALVVDTPQR